MGFPYHAVDLDGTLAEHTNSGNEFEIGKPVPLMLQRVLRWLQDGKEVRLVTARVNSEDNPNVSRQRTEIDKWCKKYIGRTLPTTCKKSHAMIELWDDRAIQVIPNTGERVLALDGNLLSRNSEDLHCSDHSFFSTGCSNCHTTSLFSSYVKDEKLEKVAPRIGIHSLEIKPSSPSPKIQLIKNQLERKVYVFLVNAASDSATALRKNYLKKVDRDVELLAVAWAAIQWDEFVQQVYSDIYEVAKMSMQDGLAQLEIQEEVEKLAEEYAKTRTTDMVGEGTRYSIADTTKEDIKSLVDKSIEEKTSEVELANDIKAASTFSRSRAALIADTEVTMGMVFNHLEIWKRSGKVKSVNIVLSDDHTVTDLCDDLAKGSPYIIEECPEIPSHPNCKCSVVAHELNQ